MNEYKIGDKVMFSVELKKRYADTRFDDNWIDEMAELMSRPYLTIQSIRHEFKMIVLEDAPGEWYVGDIQLLNILPEKLFEL